MRYSVVVAFVFGTALLSACDSGDDVGNQQSIEGLAEEQVINYIQQVKTASIEAGLEYRFDLMSPTVEDSGDTTKISFSYDNINTAGGAPVALFSDATGDVVQLDFFQ